MADRLGKYELRGVLGKGAMGTVYDGYDPLIARRVAIKTVKLVGPEEPEAAEELARFKREAQAAGRLTHPNIVGVYDYGETDEIAYIVMEFVDGPTLKSLIDKGERFSVPAITRILDGLLTGLQFSHERGVVHRDIKPANVMLTAAGQVKIADFGIARIESSSMTQAGTMLGTPAYMSPEQFMGTTVDARTDIYSTGVLLYQLLTGEKPFEGGLTAIMHKVLNTEPVAPSTLSVAVTPALDGVVKRAMAKRPEDRFASATEFAAALHEAAAAPAAPRAPVRADGEDATIVASTTTAAAPGFGLGTGALPLPPGPAAAIPAPAPAPAKPKSKLPLLAGIGAVLLLAAGGGAWFALKSSPQPPAPPSVSPVVVASTSAPTVAKSAPAPAQPTPAQIRTAIDAAFGSLSCALLSADGSAVFGLAGAGAPMAAVQTAITSLPASVVATENVNAIAGPYCDALNAIRAYHPLHTAPEASLRLSLAGGDAPLHDGQNIVVELRQPNFPGYLQVDYFSSDGSVFHLHPTSSDPNTRLAAGAALELGKPKPGFPGWAVSAPYGTDMIIAVATSVPLFPSPRPADETASDYLAALRAALQNAASSGASIAVAAVPVETLPK